MTEKKEMEYLGDKQGFLSKYYIGSGVRRNSFYDKRQTYQSRKPMSRDQLRYINLRPKEE